MKAPHEEQVPARLRKGLDQLGQDIGRHGFDWLQGAWNDERPLQAILKSEPKWFAQLPAEIMDDPNVFYMLLEKIFEGFADRAADEPLKQICKEFFHDGPPENIQKNP